MNCPNCGHTTSSETTRCGHCNVKLPGNPKPRASQPDTTLPCWNCRHANAAEAERCAHCNAKLQMRTSVPFAAPKTAYPSANKSVNV